MSLTCAQEASTFKTFFVEEILPILEQNKVSAREIEIIRIVANMTWLKRGTVQDKMEQAI